MEASVTNWAEVGTARVSGSKVSHTLGQSRRDFTEGLEDSDLDPSLLPLLFLCLLLARKKRV